MSEKGVIKSIVSVCIAIVAIAMILAHVPAELLVGLGLVAYFSFVFL